MIRRIVRKILHIAYSLLYAPNVQIDNKVPTVRLGSTYGGWNLEDRADLYGATIISCGLGEDASFDIEFASRYSARVVLVDPTPRAVAHFHEIESRLGQPATRPYLAGGKQPAAAYDLSRLGKENFCMIDKALWLHNDKIKFFAPKNIEHVSHSIVNFQNNYSMDTPYIEVECITIENLLAKLGQDRIPLMKLDIEGAESEVLMNMISKNILPEQLLIEFDELGLPSAASKAKYEKTDRALREAGYRLSHYDGHTNFLYVT